MSARRARMSCPGVLLPALLAAGAAFAAQQDVAQHDLSDRQGMEASATTDAEATTVAEERLMAWPCLDAPGCAVEDGAADLALATPVAPDALEATAIPLPAALGLMGAGLTALGLAMRRRRD